MKKLIFASGNPHKVEEAAAILGDAFQIVTPAQAGLTEEIPETGNTLRSNSLQKARYIYEHTGADCFADDHVIGWVRRGDIEHENSGVAVVMSDGPAGTLPMEIGTGFAGESFFDAMGICTEPVVIGSDGIGAFRVPERGVSVWVRQKAFEDIIVNE